MKQPQQDSHQPKSLSLYERKVCSPCLEPQRPQPGSAVGQAVARTSHRLPAAQRALNEQSQTAPKRLLLAKRPPTRKNNQTRTPCQILCVFLVLGASPSWRVLAGDPRHVTRQPPAAQGRGAPGSTGTGVCSAPCTVGEGSRAPGHSHPGFHGKNSVCKRTVTHIGSGEGSAERGPARVGDTHNSSQTIVPDPLSTTLPFRGCSVQNVLLKPSHKAANVD